MSYLDLFPLHVADDLTLSFRDRNGTGSLDGASNRRRKHVRDRMAAFRSLHVRGRRDPRRNGLDMAGSWCHVHVGVSTESEYQSVGSLGEISELDDGEFSALQSYLASGTLRNRSWLCYEAHVGISCVQIIITWQLAHNLLGVVALFTSKEYSFWVTVAICWVRLFLRITMRWTFR